MKPAKVKLDPDARRSLGRVLRPMGAHIFAKAKLPKRTSRKDSSLGPGRDRGKNPRGLISLSS